MRKYLGWEYRRRSIHGHKLETVSIERDIFETMKLLERKFEMKTTKGFRTEPWGTTAQRKRPAKERSRG